MNLSGKELQSVREMARKWALTERRVRMLCAEGKVAGAVWEGKHWRIPSDCPRPADGRSLRYGGIPKDLVGQVLKVDALKIDIENRYRRIIHAGTNEVDGVPVEVVRRRCRRIGLRVDSEGGVRLTVPKWGATLREGEAFLRSKWGWVLKAREKALARPAAARAPVTDAEVEALRILLSELNGLWSARVGEPDVAWKVRRVKSVWGCCHWRRRTITYNAELARAPRELVEYVVVHEFTHFAVHGHGPGFYALMDKRLPGWRDLRRRLNRREWGPSAPTASPPPVVPVPAARPCARTPVQDFLPGF